VARVLAILLAAAVVAFGLDSALWHWYPLSGRQYSSFPVRKVYAVKQKNGSTSFLFDDPAPQTCVNSMFPHSGASPCWYVSRHPEKRIEMCDNCGAIQLR
jgi:hypothetical protein